MLELLNELLNLIDPIAVVEEKQELECPYCGAKHEDTGEDVKCCGEIIRRPEAG